MTLQPILDAEQEILDALEKAFARKKIAYLEYHSAVEATRARIEALGWVIAEREQGLGHE